MNKDQKILDKYRKENPWGLSISVDLKQCNPDKIRSAEKIKEFVDQLCKIIKVKKYGETILDNFGENERVFGYSMIQLIETSLISGHFSNQSNAVYLDIFSCGEFPPYKVAQFCKEFYEANEVKLNITFRY